MARGRFKEATAFNANIGAWTPQREHTLGFLLVSLTSLNAKYEC